MITPIGPHLDDDSMDVLLGAVNNPAVRDLAEQHVAQCAACASRLAAMRSLYGALRELPQQSRPGVVAAAPSLAVSRDAGVRRDRRLWSLAGRVAAALALFASGCATGALLARETAAVPAIAETPGAAEALLRVQASGTAYVEALAALTKVRSEADENTRAFGREVVFSTLHGAVQEALVWNDVPAMQVLAQSAHRIRLSVVVPQSLERNEVRQ